MNGPPALPIDDLLPSLLAALAGHGNAVVTAPPGAGKTTRVPPALLDALPGSGRVLVLEPRRVAARAAARRIAAERGWEVGREVGYQIRFERRFARDTRLLFATEGILVQRMQEDPLLSGVAAIVFDEVHERNLFTDLALAMARRVQREVRPDLHLLAMSATLDAARFAAFLGEAPLVASAGRAHPVEIVTAARRDERPLPAQVASAVERALAATPGDLLVFLPGVGEIEACQRALAALAKARGLALVPLFGDLPSAEQDAALSPQARRRIVLATNVAETSVTVEGVTAVVDSGLARSLRFDPALGLDRLELGRISRAAADQRAGRAGRQGPGLCLRLWSEDEQRGLLAFETPEIARVDLAWSALQLLAWGERDLARFPWFEAPPPAALERALATLDWLEARRDDHLTDLGRRLARLPLHPRLARLLLAGAELGCLAEAALAAALLSDRDPFRAAARGERGPRTSSRSDLWLRVGELERLPHAARRRLERTAAELRDRLERAGEGATGEATDLEGSFLRAVLAAYPDRVARRRPGDRARARLVGGRGVRLAATTSVLADDLLVAVDLDAGEGGEGLVRLASGIDAGWLPDERLSEADELRFDAERQRVVARRVSRYADLPLAEREVPIGDRAAAAALLAEAARRDLAGALALGAPAVADLLARLRFLSEALPELALPRCDEATFVALLPALCEGRVSFAELRDLDLAAMLTGQLSHAQRQALAREAPERLTVPSGSALRLRYEAGRPPVLAARIQELFGLAETPRLAAGRVKVLLHLLAPNQRPQQVTDDLASFWRETYPQVRRELAGRYPKHSWPDDPLTARPERGAKRRGA